MFMCCFMCVELVEIVVLFKATVANVVRKF